jgi:VanZ family protein
LTTRAHAGLICLLIIAGFLAVGLWPFDFNPRNRAVWIAGQNGIRFQPPSIVYSRHDVDLGAGSVDGGVTVELRVQADEEPAGNVYGILCVYDGRIPENLFFAQWKTAFLLRTPMDDAAGRRRYRETGLERTLRQGATRLVTVTSSAPGTDFYEDGKFARNYPRVHLSGSSLRGRLVLGDCAEGRGDWSGKLLGLATFNRHLDEAEIRRHESLWTRGRALELQSAAGLTSLYLFDEKGGNSVMDHSPFQHELTIPERYRALSKAVLLPPWKDTPHFHDVAANLAGFVPFGLFYFLYRRTLVPAKRAPADALIVLAAGGVVSAGIELAQVYLPTRSSSLTDLLCNIAGTAMGVALAMIAERRLLPRV